ncbi:CarboxypepD_reg-like domain-containing protein [Soonwooa buanensis]|uniref:CarboxypepD_reg-like domain-containing protein n=1 Tax=Soonwooa buanensis TaxID=619805 RepID=A0A1T5CEL4_9FLAO|nr:carboxypeptidase-like regulatory domain-containing protein [Soonwooa buanensis]SKB57859.1 CarboxypepD_reg-like domain-containing protein [Soonwooa buanensis]
MIKKTTLFLFFISIVSYSQEIKGKIVDTENKPVENARIGIENESVGDLTDVNGNFKIDLTNIDSSKKIKVLVSEFLPFETNIKSFINSNHEIILKEKITKIEEVKIDQKKFAKRNFGTSNSKRAYCGYDSERKDKVYREYAIRIENKKRLKVKKINLNLVSINLNSPADLIFDIQNSTNGFPDDSKSLTNETIKLTINKEDVINNKVSIDVSDKNIWTNEDFFVTVRVGEGFNGRLMIGGNIFAFSKNTYYRNYFGSWEKFSAGEPSINVDVAVEK